MTTYIKHPLIKNDSIESRLYQQVLAGDVLKKGNTMVVAPTALGKTIVAILVAADRLQKVKNSKVLILAPSKPLAIQHEASFKEFLNLPCTSITGSIKTDERVKRDHDQQHQDHSQAASYSVVFHIKIYMMLRSFIYFLLLPAKIQVRNRNTAVTEIMVTMLAGLRTPMTSS